MERKRGELFTPEELAVLLGSQARPASSSAAPQVRRASNLRWSWLFWCPPVLIAGVWLAANVMAPQYQAGSPTLPTPSRYVPEVQAVPSTQAGAARESAPSPASPTDRYVVVGNTGGIGVYLRRTPRMADKVKAWPDGTRLLIVGQDVTSEGRTWKQVRDPQGNVGWVPEEFVLPEFPVQIPKPNPPAPVSAPILRPMTAASGERCWSGPDWEAPPSVAVPECVALVFPGNSDTTVRLVWSADQIRTADLTGQGVALWTDYSAGHSLTVRYPDGSTCTGRSVGLTMPGEYLLTVHPARPSPVRVAQGEVRGLAPDCPRARNSSSSGPEWRLIRSSGGVPGRGQTTLSFTLTPGHVVVVTGGPMSFGTFRFPGGVDRGTVIVFVGGTKSTDLSVAGLISEQNWLGIFESEDPREAWPSLLADRVGAMKAAPNCAGGQSCHRVDILVLDADGSVLAGPQVR